MKHSPLKHDLSEPCPKSQCRSVQKTTQGKESVSRNNISDHSTHQLLLYICKIKRIFAHFWKCLCICWRFYSFTMINCMMLVTLISWTNTHTKRLVCGDAFLAIYFTLCLSKSLPVSRNKNKALMFSFRIDIYISQLQACHKQNCVQIFSQPEERSRKLATRETVQPRKVAKIRIAARRWAVRCEGKRGGVWCVCGKQVLKKAKATLQKIRIKSKMFL